MRLEDFSGWRLKRDLGVDKANKIYHNRHVDGSGNFGYLMVKANVWFRIDAEYTPSNLDKHLDTRLEEGRVHQGRRVQQVRRARKKVHKATYGVASTNPFFGGLLEWLFKWLR